MILLAKICLWILNGIMACFLALIIMPMVVGQVFCSWCDDLERYVDRKKAEKEKRNENS